MWLEHYPTYLWTQSARRRKPRDRSPPGSRETEMPGGEQSVAGVGDDGVRPQHAERVHLALDQPVSSLATPLAWTSPISRWRAARRATVSPGTALQRVTSTSPIRTSLHTQVPTRRLRLVLPQVRVGSCWQKMKSDGWNGTVTVS